MRNCMKKDTIFHTIKIPTRTTCRTKLYVIGLLKVSIIVWLYMILGFTILTFFSPPKKMYRKLYVQCLIVGNIVWNIVSIVCIIVSFIVWYCMYYCINNCILHCMKIVSDMQVVYCIWFVSFLYLTIAFIPECHFSNTYLLLNTK